MNITTSRRSTVRIRKQPQLTEGYEIPALVRSGNKAGDIPKPQRKGNWFQRHPWLMFFAFISSVIAGLLFLITSAHEEDTSARYRQQPTLSSIDTSLSHGHTRAIATDESFLNTPYKKSISSGVPGSTRNVNAPEYFGDGSVRRSGNNCIISTKGNSVDFGAALIECVTQR